MDGQRPLTSSGRYSPGVIAAGLGGVVALACLLALWRGSADAPEPSAKAAVRVSDVAPPSVEPTPSRQPPVTASAAGQGPALAVRAATGSDHHPPDAGVARPEPETGHPHPITDAHRRIFRENNLLGALDGAMDVGDHAALRRMNDEYRRDYPEDGHALQAGYELIADCLERPGDEALRTRAERFWRTQRASSLRRHVRRHCLAGALPHGDAKR